MNPETEILFEDGSYLRNGMRVLLADPHDRADVFDRMPHPNPMVSRLRSQWAEISNVRHRSMEVEFTATYEDGSKFGRIEPGNRRWLVKIDSTPEYKRHKAVVELVREAMEQRFTIGGSIAAMRYAIETAEKIGRIFEQGE